MITREQPQPGQVIRRHADVRAALADRRLGVPPVPSAASGIPWLRASVSRFSGRDDHPRRREIAERTLSSDPGSLRASARKLAETLIGADAGRRLDAMTLARRVPLLTLGAPLGVTGRALDELTDCVIAIAAVYPPGATRPGASETAAAAALERLLRLLGADRDEVGANRVGALVQAYDATAGLIGNTLNVALRDPALLRSFTIDQLVAETIRHDPPVRSTRRLAAERVAIAGAALASGEVVVLDLAAANRDPAVFPEPDRFAPGRFDEPGEHQDLTFGFGERSCPGRRRATAIAAGVVEAVLERCSLVEQTVAYEPSPNLRVLASLEISVD